VRPALKLAIDECGSFASNTQFGSREKCGDRSFSDLEKPDIACSKALKNIVKELFVKT